MNWNQQRPIRTLLLTNNQDYTAVFFVFSSISSSFSSSFLTVCFKGQFLGSRIFRYLEEHVHVKGEILGIGRYAKNTSMKLDVRIEYDLYILTEVENMKGGTN